MASIKDVLLLKSLIGDFASNYLIRINEQGRIVATSKTTSHESNSNVNPTEEDIIQQAKDILSQR